MSLKLCLEGWVGLNHSDEVEDCSRLQEQHKQRQMIIPEGAMIQRDGLNCNHISRLCRSSWDNMTSSLVYNKNYKSSIVNFSPALDLEACNRRQTHGWCFPHFLFNFLLLHLVVAWDPSRSWKEDREVRDKNDLYWYSCALALSTPYVAEAQLLALSSCGVI